MMSARSAVDENVECRVSEDHKPMWALYVKPKEIQVSEANTPAGHLPGYDQSGIFQISNESKN